MDRERIVLQVERLGHDFPARVADARGDRTIRALAGVSFEVRRGEILGLIGESGSGKSTLARALFQMPRPMRGSVRFQGFDLTTLRGRDLVNRRRAMQLVFQDPFGSLNPGWTVSDIVEEPLIGFRIGNRATRHERVLEVLSLVGMPVAQFGHRKPRQLSGGQCQRVALARALAPEPELLVCDEAVSELDVMVQAQITKLLLELREVLGISILFISHDLGLVQGISDRTAVLYAGHLIEIGETRNVFHRPLHPYTRDLLATLRGGRRTLHQATAPITTAHGLGEPSATRRGCNYQEHCTGSMQRCATEIPVLQSVESRGFAACHAPLRPSIVGDHYVPLRDRAPLAVTIDEG